MHPETQSILLAILPKATAILSIAASACGIKVIVRTPQRQAARCNRLIMAMFGHDILRCLTFVTGTWLVSANTDGVFMAYGNNTTCATQAFVSQLGYAVPLYSTCLSFYYYTEVKNDFKKCSVRWAEKWCHFFPNAISLVLSTILIACGQYGVDGTRCWIKTEDEFRCVRDRSYFNREGSTCAQGDISYEWFIVFIFLVKYAVIMISFVTSLTLFFHGLRVEVLKRKKSSGLRTGKRQVLEKARRFKAKMVLTRMGLNLLVFFFSFGIVSMQQFFMEDRFCLVLLGTIMTTLFGAATAAIFLNVKVPHVPTSIQVSFDPEDFSIRRSMISGTSYKMVTGGFVPKPKIILKDDGGIYMGDDDECDDDDSCFSVKGGGTAAIERSELMTSISTGSVDDNLKAPK